jgi:hypothetical protein
MCIEEVAREMRKNATAMTVRIPGEFMERLRVRLAQDGEKFQSKTLELLEEYVNGTPEESEHERRMKIAREEMERFRESFEVLSR